MRKGQIGVDRNLDPADLRSIDHPSHREQWLALARALGRLDAKAEFAALQKGETIDTRKTKTGSSGSDT
jgi:hypothetical protein